MTTEYSYKVCPVCGIHYAVDKRVMDYKRGLPSGDKDGGWHCPNGHSLIFTENENDRLRRERDRLKQDAARLEDYLREEAERADAAERRARAAKGQVTKLKKRASHGVCPCCNRSFENLRRHMETKHPEFAKQADNVVPLTKAG